ncbi:MAG: DsbA family protein [Acidobacteria bacterium]|nr:DsbA family protein [Acidobacteriota bacterium]
MRKLLFSLSGLCLAAPLWAAPASVVERLTAYFADWYAAVPGTHVAVSPARDVTVAGFSAFRVERVAEAGGTARVREESSVTLYDSVKDQVFLGEVLHDASRAAARHPFDAGSDLPVIRASLQEAFGVAVRIDGPAPGTGPLLPMTLFLRQDQDAFAARPGFISADGATLLLGEFRPVGEGAARWRRALLSDRPGIRPDRGSFYVAEFLDFQCERCRLRAPEVRLAVARSGGALDVHFLPLVQAHDWAFAAAESAAGLAAADPALYARYQEMIFERPQGMTAASARQLAADVAEGAGAVESFRAEVVSHRARDRVLHDIELALRLGIHGTPAFVLDGRLVPGERGLLENAVFLARGGPSAKRAPSPAPDIR